MKINIFFDLDETLIHTVLGSKLCDTQVQTFVEPDGYQYWTFPRYQASPVVDYARETFGAENVYILTIGTYDYACAVNDAMNLGFEHDHIWARGDLEHSASIGYMCNKSISVRDHRNILIDNREYAHNMIKVNFLRMSHRDYFECVDFQLDMLALPLNQERDVFGEEVSYFLRELASEVN